ncbi:putative bifunctional diguanylate cyclase/phosphodiesterase [Methylobacterium segetis]|uniref:putative bifunctional diguanylate cyclase/phosphodiesterase n=1 Tax=Methylobacterium segetis TaxID=2488750 RepID=UPI0010532971|nr:EAL domain-containing protein [Methylobacterium segetis]
MRHLVTFLSLFRIAPDRPDLHIAQIKSVSRQAPLFFGIMTLNAALLVYTHAGVAPAYLTYLPMAVVGSVSVIRCRAYHRLSKATLDAAVAYRQLRMLNAMVVVLLVSLLIWCLALMSFGDVYTRMHVMFFVVFGIMACVFGLLHVRSAALMAVTIALPASLYFFATGNGTLRAIAVAFLALAVTTSYLVFVYHRVFTSLVQQTSELRRLSDDNLRLANVDLLTNLPNRRSFFSKLQAVLSERKESGFEVQVGLIDLDGFKPVNDTYGHPAGDALLREIGSRLHAFCDEHVFLARLGGDEFGIVVAAPGGCVPSAELGASLAAALSQPIRLAKGVVHVGATIGFAAALAHEDKPDRIIERADSALYHAKANARGSTIVFTQDLDQALRRRDLIVQGLRQADLEAELLVLMQPMVDVVRNRVVAFEALARWHSPFLGLVSPSEFIPVAESSDLIQPITELLLRKALAPVSLWPLDIGLSFNLSARDIISPHLVRRMGRIIAESGVTPERITFEVTETALIGDFEQAKANLEGLKAIGCRIALDDFGTGFSSLSYVHRLPLDRLKIDRSFTSEMESVPVCQDIVETMLLMSRNLGLGCVAEGVESGGQMALLRSLGCETMQGFYFHRPMPIERVAGFLERFADSALVPGTACAA